jgi:hypothetical protein
MIEQKSIKSSVKDQEPSSRNPRINRRQAIALGLATIGLGDQALLRRTDNRIEREVSRAETTAAHSPSIPDTYAEDIRQELQEDVYYQERTNGDVIALLASAGILFIDKHLSKKPSPDSQQD